MTLLPIPIAQTSGAPLEILLWSAVLIGLLLVAWFVVALVRNRASGWAEQSQSSPFSLHQLRRLHREGQLTDDEFERARQRVLEMAGAAPAEPDRAEEEPPPGPSDRSDEPPDGDPDSSEDGNHPRNNG